MANPNESDRRVIIAAIEAEFCRTRDDADFDTLGILAERMVNGLADAWPVDSEEFAAGLKFEASVRPSLVTKVTTLLRCAAGGKEPTGDEVEISVKSILGTAEQKARAKANPR